MSVAALLPGRATARRAPKGTANPPALSYYEVLAAACRGSFWRFVREFWSLVPGASEPVWNWHMKYMCDVLQRHAERVFQGLPKVADVIFNVPPGTSKSTIASILFHCWIWTRMPQARFLSASHASELALDLATKARTVITSARYRACFPDIELAADQDAKGYYRNTLGGDRFTCTVSGRSPVGFHAHFQVTDDAIDPKRARSETHKQVAREFLTDVLPGRKVDKAVTFSMLIMQRLGVGDPTDVLLEISKGEDAVPVEHYCLPAELADNVNPPELAQFYVDGLLDPHRLSRAILKKEQATMGPYAYAGQFGQRPFLPGGGMFKDFWFQPKKSAPFKCKRVFFVDRASTPDGGCYTAGVLMARDDEGNYYIEDVLHGQWEPDERNQKIKAALIRYRRKYGKFEPRCYIESEGGSSGRDAFKLLAKVLAGFVVREVRVTGSKDVRAEPWASQLAAKNVYVVDNGESEGHAKSAWDVSGYILEHVAFKPDPHSKRLGGLKDRVDASSGAYNVLCQGMPRGSLPLRKLSFRDGLGAKAPDKPRFVLCDYEAFARLHVDVPVVVLHVHDPSEGPGPHPLPPSGCDKIAAHVPLTFADVDPEELGPDWDEPDEALGCRPSEACLTREIIRPAWSALLKRHDPPFRAVIVVGDDRRAASVAHGLADGLRFERKAVYLSADPSDINQTGVDAPCNRHAYEVVKLARHSVMG